MTVKCNMAQGISKSKSDPACVHENLTCVKFIIKKMKSNIKENKSKSKSKSKTKGKRKSNSKSKSNINGKSKSKSNIRKTKARAIANARKPRKPLLLFQALFSFERAHCSETCNCCHFSAGRHCWNRRTVVNFRMQNPSFFNHNCSCSCS